MAQAQLHARGRLLRAWRAGGLLRAWWQALLLVLALGVHQGAYLHELSHYAPATTQDTDHPEDAGGPCALCLAYAGVETGVSPASSPPALLAGLSFVLIAVAAAGACAVRAPAQRNRGPPELR